jgi:hypothetical protein
MNYGIDQVSENEIAFQSLVFKRAEIDSSHLDPLWDGGSVFCSTIPTIESGDRIEAAIYTTKLHERKLTLFRFSADGDQCSMRVSTFGISKDGDIVLSAEAPSHFSYQVGFTLRELI